MTATPWLAGRAAARPDHPAVICGGRSLGYAALADRAGGVAAWLRDRGVERGGVVAAHLGNGLPFAELVHGAARLGAALLPLNRRWTAGELAQPLRASRARLLVHDSGDPRALFAATLADVPALRFPRDAGSAAVGREPPVAADSPAAVIFTSGTTGTPKGAELSFGNFQWSAFASAARLGSEPGDRWLACLPLFHVGGLSILVRAALFGSTVVVHERFDPAAANRALDREGITHVSLVATTLERLLEERGDRPAPPQLRCVLLGGGPSPAPLVERARGLGFRVAPTYGLTEAASQVATAAPDDPAGRVRPLAGTAVRIADSGGRDLPDGSPGEILVRGPTVMRGYVDCVEATARALRDGWLHTGDIGVRSSDGALAVLERRSDLIVSGGENVYPSEVEGVLLAHPAIVEAAVARVPDPDYGQRAAAWLVFRPGAAPDEHQLRAFCSERLAGYKVPVAFHGVDALPRNATGKLLRSELVGARPSS